jgi:hypothetical protein
VLPGRVVGGRSGRAPGPSPPLDSSPAARDGTDETMPQERYLFRGSLLTGESTRNPP